MSKHTPGPWHVSKRNPLSVVEAGPRASQIAKMGIKLGVCSQQDAEANARLIAAAPNLLAALRAMLVATDSKETEAFKGHYDTYLHTVAIPRAIAAIAKATGETE